MLTYRVDDMTCGHCASTIAKAVTAVDAAATVRVDLPRHLVTIDANQASAGKLVDAIKDAGYSPVPVEPVETIGKPAGSCCGGCH